VFTADGSQTMQPSFNITLEKIVGGIFINSKCEQNQTESSIWSERTKHLNRKIAFLSLVQRLPYYLT